MFDDQGRSNELIVTLAYSNKPALRRILPALSDSAGRQIVESQIVTALRRNERAADFAFQSPAAAQHLTELSRLQDTERAELPDEHPREKLEQYLLLRYSSVAAALQARERLKSHPVVASVANSSRVHLSWSPNDQYFGSRPDHRHYQWGLHEMNFPAAWDVSRGHAYVGILEPAVQNDLATLPPDARENHRDHIAWHDSVTPPTPESYLYHSTHVLGIIGAKADNSSLGIAGACPSCSTAFFEFPQESTAIAAFAISKAVERGVQVLNWSGGIRTDVEDYPNCAALGTDPKGLRPICDALNFARVRKVLVVTAAGNGDETNLAEANTKPQFPGEHSAVIAVAGAEEYFPAGPSPYYQQQPTTCYQTKWCRWIGWQHPQQPEWRNRTLAPGAEGVFAPARSVVSTVAPGTMLYQGATQTDIYRCVDRARDNEGLGIPDDESGLPGDGYGSCTGTSMAAPHISALAGIIRSINPLLPAISATGETRKSVKTIIQQSGSHGGFLPTGAYWGYGMPDAAIAVADALAQTPNRLTPLFSFYSTGRMDYFYTTVPQMATAALIGGTIAPYPCVSFPCAPSYRSKGGTTIYGYDSFPDIPLDWNTKYRLPQAEVWIFTTPQNPKNPSLPLTALYRFSWKCGDHPGTARPVPAVCATNPHHSDFAYATVDQPSEVNHFLVGMGYKLDGIEGYVYPKSMAQPPGTVRLMRKYNSARDDRAIFPETRLAAMMAEGYTLNTGSDWIGYVYPNTNGLVPAIQ